MVRVRKRSKRVDGRCSVCVTVDARLWNYAQALLLLKEGDPWRRIPQGSRSAIVEEALDMYCRRTSSDLWWQLAQLKTEGRNLEVSWLSETLHGLPPIPTPQRRNKRNGNRQKCRANAPTQECAESSSIE